jgi:branched-chain amino acid transport system ATP-binding protein
MDPKLLEVRGLKVAYNRAAVALHGISFEVPAGSIVGLIGTNGAGKTTTLQAIAGFMRGDAARITDGEILFKCERIEHLLPHRISSLGVGLIPEQGKIFSNLSVEENLRASGSTVSASRQVIDIQGVFELFPALMHRRKLTSGFLSGGERQMLAIAMGLLGAPDLLLIDEMSLGLAPTICMQLAKLIRRLRDQFGLTVLVVEQNAVLALDIVDSAYVLENGRIISSGAAKELRNNSRFRDIYLGLDPSEASRSYRRVKRSATTSA